MSRTRSAFLVLFALFALPASAADVAPVPVDAGNKCKIYTMCSAEATATFCGPAADANVIRVDDQVSAALTAVGSTGTFTVNLQMGGVGRTALGASGAELGTDISTATGIIRTDSLPSRYLWVNVDSCTGCSVTAELMLCSR